jgi:hypothetical protein
MDILEDSGYHVSPPCGAAAAAGDLEALKWARINGCDWNENICQIATANRHLGILKWARMNGCPWDKRTCQAAAAGGI